MIDSTNSLYSEEERLNSSRLGILPPLIDEKECHHTIVRMATVNPSLSQPQAEFGIKNNHSEFMNSDFENSEDRTSTKCAASKNGTWFHFNLCLGMLGFVIFWLFLMLRIYLPESYWTWSYIWWSREERRKNTKDEIVFLHVSNFYEKRIKLKLAFRPERNFWKLPSVWSNAF